MEEHTRDHTNTESGTRRGTVRPGAMQPGSGSGLPDLGEGIGAYHIDPAVTTR